MKGFEVEQGQGEWEHGEHEPNRSFEDRDGANGRLGVRFRLESHPILGVSPPAHDNGIALLPPPPSRVARNRCLPGKPLQ